MPIAESLPRSLRSFVSTLYEATIYKYVDVLWLLFYSVLFFVEICKVREFSRVRIHCHSVPNLGEIAVLLIEGSHVFGHVLKSFLIKASTPKTYTVHFYFLVGCVELHPGEAIWHSEFTGHSHEPGCEVYRYDHYVSST